MGWKRTERTENSSSCANVLHRTLNLVISRRHLGYDGKEMYQNVKRTCRAIVFAHQIYCFVASSLPSASSFHRRSRHRIIIDDDDNYTDGDVDVNETAKKFNMV